MLTIVCLTGFALHHASPNSVSQSSTRPPVALPSIPNSITNPPVGFGDVRLAVPERDTVPLSSDPNEAAARRAIDHALPRLGLPPPAGDDGHVHLHNGDTISREQYEDVQRKLQHNPLVGQPLPTPRL